jgi:hypothetical protein
MKPCDLAAIHAYLDDTIDATGLETLQPLLRRDADARKTLRRLATIDTKLEQLAAGDAESLLLLGPRSPTGRRHQPALVSWKNAAAVAAGAILAFACMPIVFAYVPAAFGIRRLALLQEGFESGPGPRTLGMPIVPGVWGGDSCRLVGPQPGLRPADGSRMLQMLRADYEGKPPCVGSMGDIYRMLDLRDHQPLLADGDAVLLVEAAFASTGAGRPGRYRCGIWLETTAELPASGGEQEVFRIVAAERDSLRAADAKTDPLIAYSPASAHRTLVFPSNAADWQRLRVAMPVSPGTRYVIIKLEVTDSEAIAERLDSSDVHFPGQYLDDIRVTLVREPVQP